MKRFAGLSLLGFWVAGTSLATGSTSSGGGGIHRDEGNPWFLENTEVVHYCIDLDEANFGASQKEASLQVKNALNDWLDAFKASYDGVYRDGELEPYGQVRVGTQKFIEHPCTDDPSISLRFQLGKLTNSMKKDLENPADFVGIAVRTNYDRANLRGQGFIYLAPVSGPLKPDHDGLYNRAWSSYGHLAFRLILRHELGHVFGLQHTSNTIMDADWPEHLVDERFLKEIGSGIMRFEYGANLLGFFGLSQAWHSEGCDRDIPISILSIFDREAAKGDCGVIDLKEGKLAIKYKPTNSTFFETIASAQQIELHTTSSTSVTVYFTKEQQVFTSLPSDAKRFGRLFGEYRNHGQRGYGEIHIESTGEILPLTMIMHNDSIFRGTILKNGHYYDDSFSL